jgi:transposase
MTPLWPSPRPARARRCRRAIIPVATCVRSMCSPARLGVDRGPGQAHIALRADILQADTLWQRVERVRHGSLSAAERASYDRALDAVATRLCRR